MGDGRTVHQRPMILMVEFPIRPRNSQGPRRHGGGFLRRLCGRLFSGVLSGEDIGGWSGQAGEVRYRPVALADFSSWPDDHIREEISPK